jgi:hypothetical protein
MAEKDRVNSLLYKLQRQSTLTADEVSELQTHIDQLESVGRAAASHHESHSTPGSHYTNHHTSVVDVAGVLERIALKRTAG